jgi:hypothetical protein
MDKILLEKIVERKAMGFRSLNELWRYYRSHGIDDLSINNTINAFQGKYRGDTLQYFERLKKYFYEKYILEKIK